MAKRSRGSTRPGRRARLQRPAPRPADAARRSGGLTHEEEQRAAEIEAAIVAEERAAQNAARRTRDRDRDRGVEGGYRRDLAPLSVRAADEYAYVRRDVLRIARIGGGLLVVMAILYVLIDVTHAIRL
jgi:hypothetical protein